MVGLVPSSQICSFEMKKFRTEYVVMATIVVAAVFCGCMLVRKPTTELSESLTDHLQLWLRADKGVFLVDGVVSQWTDQSGKGNHAVAAEGSVMRLEELAENAQPAILFNGTSALRIPHADGLNADGSFTTFIVYKVSSGFRLAQKKDASTGLTGTAWFVTPQNGMAVSGKSPTKASFETGVLHIQANVFDAELGEIHVYSNGTEVELVTDVPLQQANEDPVYIGRRNQSPSAGFITGYIAEFIIYDTNLSADERCAVEGYLRQKYAINESQ